MERERVKHALQRTEPDRIERAIPEGVDAGQGETGSAVPERARNCRRPSSSSRSRETRSPGKAARASAAPAGPAEQIVLGRVFGGRNALALV